MFGLRGRSPGSVRGASVGIGIRKMAELEKMKVFTDAEREALRQVALNEVGTMPPCPFCGKPRVARSSYMRCQRCGVNWLDEEVHLRDYLNRNPSACRWEAAHMGTGTKSGVTPSAGGAE